MMTFVNCALTRRQQAVDTTGQKARLGNLHSTKQGITFDALTGVGKYMYNSLILIRPCRFTGHLSLPDAVYLEHLLRQKYDIFVIMPGCNTDPCSVDP